MRKASERQRGRTYLSGTTPRSVGEVRYRGGTSFIRENTVDPFLADKDELENLYKKWDSEKWEEPLTFRGGVRAITCEMILRVPLSELSKVYGAKRAKFFTELAKKRGNPMLVKEILSN